MDLVHDLLDKKVVDRHGRELGRVDSIVAEASGSTAPRVIAIELGLSVLGGRIGPFAGRCGAALERLLGIDAGRPVRIPFSSILDVREHVRVDCVAAEMPTTALERRLRDLVHAIPGVS